MLNFSPKIHVRRIMHSRRKNGERVLAPGKFPKRFATASTFTQVVVLPWRYDA